VVEVIGAPETGNDITPPANQQQFQPAEMAA
jgi:hypothetical protein